MGVTNNLLAGAVVPHPPIMIPEIAQNRLSEISSTVEAMNRLSKEIKDINPETLIFISPHSPMAGYAFAIKGQASLKGDLGQFGYLNLEYGAENDLEMALEIEKISSEEEISTIMVAGEETEYANESCLLDHGVLAPYHYLSKEWVGKLVSISISGLSFMDHYKFGRIIKKSIDNLKRKTVFIASGDLSHRLTTDAPAGYNPRGQEFDNKIVTIFKEAEFERLFKLKSSLIEDAGECGLRSLICLSGLFEDLEVDSQVLSYEGPFGVGYMVAIIKPIEKYERNKFVKANEKDLKDASESSFPVKLATSAIKNYILKGKLIKVPKDTPNFLKGRAATFVSIKKHGQLRGCIGTTKPQQGSTAKEIIQNAISAATQDPRFNPVMSDEINLLDISVDILTEPEPISDLNKLDPKKYGVIVTNDLRTGLLLPDLDGVETVDEQISISKKKAGIKEDEDIKIYRFEVKRYY